MVVYNYTVSSAGPTYTVQEVLNRISFDLSSNPTIENDIVISIMDGSYPGFVIPNGLTSVLLNTGYRLIIRSAGQYFPILDFNLSTDTNVGIDIGAGNPNVTISGLRVQYFPVGVRATINSHFPIIKNCIISNNRNAGILVDRCDETQIIQNVVINGDYGIVVRTCRSAIIIHNTIFQNGSISTEVGKSISSIWASLGYDYGNGTSDTGILHIIGNVAWNTVGNTLTLFSDDVERQGAIVSNYNDFVVGDPNKYISIEDRTFYRGPNSAPRRNINSLLSWKQLGFDQNSINQDPKFIAPVRVRTNRNGFAVDLNLLSISPVLGLVPSFFVNSELAAEWLPSYFDTENISKDILNTNRIQSGTAAGANDRTTTSGFYGQDIFTNPLDLDIVKNCDTNPLLDLTSTKLDIWFPELNVGYFHSNERQYYLYANKACKTLGQIGITKFRLPSKVVHNLPITLYVNGNKIEDPEYIDIIGDDLYLYHKDLDIKTTNEEIDIQCWVSKWISGQFSNQETHFVFKINEGTTRYFLPSNYYPRGPVVVTDDYSYPTDSDIISNREFTLQFDEFEQKTEVIFNNKSNVLLNGQFDYSPDSSPYLWESSDVVVQKATYPNYSVAGPYIAKISNSGYLAQLLPYSSSGSCFSFFAYNSGSGTLRYEAHAYDNYNEDLGFTFTGTLSLGDYWNRFYITFGHTGDVNSGRIIDEPFSLRESIYRYIPEETASIHVKLYRVPNSDYSGYVAIDACQYEYSSYPSLYHRKPFLNEITVEYETSSSTKFIDYHQSIAPVRNYSTDGFLYIPEIPASVYGGPSTPSITTLHEWKWPEGRSNIIPWSRTKGKDKLSCRPNSRFNYKPLPKPEIIHPVLKAAGISDINIYPNTPVVRQGDTNGIGISVSVTDTDGNPAGLAKCILSIEDRNLMFPGYLYKANYGLKEQLNQTIGCLLDSAGIVNITWVPPESDSALISFRYPKPISRTSIGSRLSYLDTKYPINLDNMGNLIILDSEGIPLPLYSSSTIKASYVPNYTSDMSKVYLPYPIKPESLVVKVNNKILNQSSNLFIDSDQFFVDYENSEIVIKGRYDQVYIEYTPLYYIVNKINPNRVILYHDEIFSSYSNTDYFTAGYDYLIKLNISVEDATELLYVTQSFDLIAQNSLINKKNTINPISLEI